MACKEKKKKDSEGEKKKKGGLEKTILVSVCGCTGYRAAAAFGTNSA